ncbi:MULTISPECIES: hypothetical protein [unclassified Sulfurospirillum]|nr:MULTISPECIES: hypothetical protein [unclassified Sulfurospirillum]
MKAPKISKETIKKVVSISQSIEGYKPTSKPLQQQAKEIMAKYNVKISA